MRRRGVRSRRTFWHAGAVRHLATAPGAGGPTGTVPAVSLIAATLLLDAADDAGLIDACGEKPGWFCEATWNLTHNRMLSRAIDWIIAGPVAAIIVLVVAAVLNRWLRRAVTALIERITSPPAIAIGAMEMIGVASSEPDPREEARAATLSAVARASVSSFVWSISILIVLGLFHVDLAPLLAGAGIAGLAVGLGSQSLVRDCIAGFFILLEDQCGVGDDVDLGTTTGTVESLTLRMMRVRGNDGTLWNVPNGAIQKIGNRNRNWSQVNLDIPVALGADLEHAMEVMQAALASAASSEEIATVLLREPQILGVERIDMNSTVVRISIRTVAGQQWTVLRVLRLAVKRALDAQGLSPTPTTPPPTAS